ncbi:unnamed protein product [Leuciscus chuanchicus]
MLTTRKILAQVCRGDWFMSIDLKDAYFQIQIASHHRRYLRFAFEGQTYQYTVLPFGLSLAPRTFTKCMDAALAPLRLRGMRVLNYLDDWLILAQSRSQLVEHRTILLDHLENLGITVNWTKSSLNPGQTISFLGTILDSQSMTARLSPQRVLHTQRVARSFRCGASTPLKTFQRMLGLMASASPVLQLGLLRMRPLQFWLKARVPRGAWVSGRLRLMVNQSCITALTPWLADDWYRSGVSLGTSSGVRMVSTDASNSGWGALLEGRPLFGLWSKREKLQHINCLEMLAVHNALTRFYPQIKDQHVVVRSDNTAVVSYINRQGGLKSTSLYRLAKHLLIWAHHSLRSLRAVHVPGLQNVGPDRLSRNNIPLGEWSLHPQTVRLLWERFGRAEVDLFASRENAHCPVFFSKNDSALSHSTVLDQPSLVSSPDAASRHRSMASAIEERSPLAGRGLDLAPAPGAVVASRVGTQRLSVDLAEGVINTITQARAPSTRRLYASKWSVFSGWCTARSISPIDCEVTEVLSFLQELLDKGRSPSTLKVYVAAITAFSGTTLGQSLGRNDLVIRFLRGARRLNPPRPPSVPMWDLSTVLAAMKGAPFEPIQSISLKHLSFKTVFLMALASVKRIGDLHALSVSPACLEFGPNDSKVILKPKHGYVPKSLNTPFRAQVISLSALPGSDIEQRLAELGGRERTAHLEEVLQELWSQEQRNEEVLHQLSSNINSMKGFNPNEVQSNPPEEKKPHVLICSVDGPLSAQTRALRLAYMQSGGSDPEVLAHMHDLQAEALTLEQARPRADGKTKGRRMKSPHRVLDPDVLAVEQENQKLEEEIFRIQLARERHKGEHGLIDIQKDHIHQMASLQAEIAFLKREIDKGRDRRPPHPQPPLSMFPGSSMAHSHSALTLVG